MLGSAGVKRLSASLLLGVTGCNNKVKDCSQLPGTINATGKKIKALEDPGKDPAKIEAATAKYAALFDQGKKDISALHFKDVKLEGFAKEYTNLATSASTSAHELEASPKTVEQSAKDGAKEQKSASDGVDL